MANHITAPKQLSLFDPIRIPLSKHGKKYAGLYEALVDPIDSDLAHFNWNVCTNERRRTPHALRTTPDNKGKWGPVWMHRIILSRILGRELLSTEQVDHINRDGLDNRRANLRLATPTQNRHNAGKSSTNTSGYKGVHWDKKYGKWRAKIWVDKRCIFLGYFRTPQEAHEAYKNAAKEYHKEFAYLGDD